jgi:general secretion pathway protein D
MLLAIVTAACEKAEVRENVRKIMRDPIDREGDITYNEFKNTLRPAGSAVARNKQLENTQQSTQKDEDEDEEELDLAPVLLPPDEPEIKSNRLVSLSITPDVKIRDVLLEVARQAKLDMAIDPYIEGGIYLSVKDKPVGDVVKMISELAELKYTVEDSVLRIERDKPYIENYSVDIMNLTRSTTGSVTTNTSVSGISTSGGGGSGLTTGSSNKIDLTSSGDLWKAIDDNLKKIIELEFVTTLKEEEVDDSGQLGGENNNNQTSLNAPTNANRQNAQQNRSNTSNNNQANEDADKGSYYTINKQAGIITVNATQKKHKFVQKYLAQLKKSLSTQVLIEAKVLEVNLAEQFGSGISWRDLINGSTFNVGATAASKASGVSSPAFTGSIFDSVLTVKGKDPFNKPRLSYIIEAIQQYGTIRTLSNPRITALNNQQSVLTFALNKPFYEIKVTASSTTSNSNSTTTQNPTMNATVKTVPIGVILTIYPLIHIETGEITMNIRPTISRDTGETIRDPSVDYIAGTLENAPQKVIDLITDNNKGIPIVEVRELDTVLKIKSGDVIVLGGLIEHRDQSTDSGIPFLSKIPIIGNLAKKTYKTSSVKETVILIQATILNSDGYTHEHDRNMYKTFAQDPRPLTF